MQPSGSVSLGLLILRLAAGITLLVHGWQKYFEFGLAGVQKSFAGMNVPLPEVSAVYQSTLELVGGIALIVGLATRIVGVLVAISMAYAAFAVHLSAGFFAVDGGYELVMLIGAAGLALAFTGPGRASIDGLLFGRNRNRTEDV